MGAAEGKEVDEGAAASSDAMSVICHCDMSEGDVVTSFGCPFGHRFHLDCLLPWLERRSCCPLCRYDLQSAEGGGGGGEGKDGQEGKDGGGGGERSRRSESDALLDGVLDDMNTF